MRIESTKNPIYKELLSLTKSKGLREKKKCLVSGEKITLEISKLSKVKSFWIHTDKMSLPSGDWKNTISLSDELFKNIDTAGTKKPILCSEFKEFISTNGIDSNLPTLFVALSDPTNLGALIRTCAAFDWLQIVLLKESAHPFLPKAIRAASGTCFSMHFFNGPSINDLKDPDIFALDMDGKVINSQNLKKNLKILVGEEGKGVPKEFVGQKIKIPISNKVESLNATIATSLLIYEWSKI